VCVVVAGLDVVIRPGRAVVGLPDATWAPRVMVIDMAMCLVGNRARLGFCWGDGCLAMR